MIFANDRLLARDEVFAESLRQKGVLWLPLDQAMRTSIPTCSANISCARRRSSAGRNSPRCMQSQVRAGTFLYVPRGVEIDLPIEAFHWLHGSERFLLSAHAHHRGGDGKVTFVDYFESADATAPGLACARQ